jgi:hypothetical protein
MAMRNTTRAELAANIQKHQWVVFNITGSSEAALRFSYTVGLFETFGHPEVVISGLPNDVALAILNNIGSDVAKGISREAEVLYDDILEGYPCVFKPVPTRVYEAYFGRALVFYEGADFPVLQCLWPDALKRFPGDFGYVMANQEALFEH